MFDIRTWKDQATLPVWAAIIYTCAAAAYGTVTGAYNLYQFIDAHLNPKVVSAVLTFGDFQRLDYDVLTVTFVNATNRTQSIDNVSFVCTTSSGHRSLIFPVNDNPPPMVPSGLVEMPIAVGAGEPRKVTFGMLKMGRPSIVKDCTSLQPMWTDADRKSRTGDSYTLGAGAVTFDNMVLNKQ